MEGAHLLLYDGVCGLCNALLRFVLEHDRRAVFVYASLQSAVGRSTVARFGGDPDALTTFYVISDYQSSHARLLMKSGAALFLARELGWPWKVVALARVCPAAVLDPLYDVVARSRYRIFGRVDACLIPRVELARRFIDR